MVLDCGGAQGDASGALVGGPGGLRLYFKVFVELLGEGSLGRRLCCKGRVKIELRWPSDRWGRLLVMCMCGRMGVHAHTRVQTSVCTVRRV